MSELFSSEYSRMRQSADVIKILFSNVSIPICKNDDRHYFTGYLTLTDRFGYKFDFWSYHRHIL